MSRRDVSENLDATADEDYRELHGGADFPDVDLDDDEVDAELAAAAPDEEEEEEEFIYADIPTEFKHTRACLRCQLIKQYDQFYKDGCENCEFLDMAESKDRINQCTTAFYEGMIALLEPQKSWVAKWQRFQSNVPGLYAIEVAGMLVEEDFQKCKEFGYTYKIPAESKYSTM